MLLTKSQSSGFKWVPYLVCQNASNNQALQQILLTASPIWNGSQIQSERNLCI